MSLLATLLTAIPAAIHLHRFYKIRLATPMTLKIRCRLQAIEVRQIHPALMKPGMAIVTQQNQILGLVATTITLHLHMMIFKATMVSLLLHWRALANTTTQTIAQIDLKTRSVIDAHFDSLRRRRGFKVQQ
jgi:hypothetical protein